jgi:hypothetical protein
MIMGWLEALHDVIGDTGMQFLPAVVLGLLAIVPAMHLLKRVGMSRAWALLSFFPGLGLIVMVWIIAFAQWKPTKV